MALLKYQTIPFKCVQLRDALPQGSVTSSTMFNVMINDLICNLTKISGIKCLNFADNIVIYTTSADTTDNEGMTVNEGMRALKDWCSENVITFNSDKTLPVVYFDYRK
ncbi:hypothetical protein CDAR_471291 [Caerostris darwini]|uniref:Reverse transcriptase domain-containing protein n=1 Tax=Caerostris darwini TaxID=1538125 RepID=A0AAV4RI73_9ARAC|nr:hypothetical protein CDAR_471291 [Caerostris darwini]